MSLTLPRPAILPLSAEVVLSVVGYVSGPKTGHWLGLGDRPLSALHVAPAAKANEDLAPTAKDRSVRKAAGRDCTSKVVRTIGQVAKPSVLPQQVTVGASEGW
jgi:hypothetical protein